MTSAMRRRRFRWLQFGDPPPMRCFVFRLLLPWLLNWWWRQSFIGNHRPSQGMWVSLGGTMTRGHRRRRRIVSFSFSDQWRVPIWFDPSDGERIHNKKLCFSGEGGGSISSCSSKISRLRVLLFSPHHAKSKANKKKNRICLHKSLFRYCAHSSSPLLLLTFFFSFFAHHDISNKKCQSSFPITLARPFSAKLMTSVNFKRLLIWWDILSFLSVRDTRRVRSRGDGKKGEERIQRFPVSWEESFEIWYYWFNLSYVIYLEFIYNNIFASFLK